MHEKRTFDHLLAHSFSQSEWGKELYRRVSELYKIARILDSSISISRDELVDLFALRRVQLDYFVREGIEQMENGSMDETLSTCLGDAQTFVKKLCKDHLGETDFDGSYTSLSNYSNNANTGTVRECLISALNLYKPYTSSCEDYLLTLSEDRIQTIQALDIDNILEKVVQKHGFGINDTRKGMDEYSDSCRTIRDGSISAYIESGKTGLNGLTGFLLPVVSSKEIELHSVYVSRLRKITTDSDYKKGNSK